MKLPHKRSIILGIGIFMAAAAIAAVILFMPRASVAPAAPKLARQQAPGAQMPNKIAGASTSTFPLRPATIPHGLQTYQIMQGGAATPKIVQATVDPVDVHVGDIQTMTVIVSDPDPISSAVAIIQTDNGTTTVPLTLVGPAALNEVLPSKYFVNAQNELALVTPGKGDSDVALAAQGDEKYSGTWTVKDTHIAKYSTTFVIKDTRGNMNSARIDWTDTMCEWVINNNAGASVSVSSLFGTGGCSMGAGDPVDGVSNGNLNIDAPLTVAAGTTLVVTPGNTITFSGGNDTLTIAAGGTIAVNHNMYGGTDADGDGYLAGNAWSLTSGTVRSSLSGSNTIGDCNDHNANVHPGQTAWFTTPTTTNMNDANEGYVFYDGGGEVNYDYDCDSQIEYRDTALGTVTYAGFCDDSSGICYPGTWIDGLAYEVGCGQPEYVLGAWPDEYICAKNLIYCDGVQAMPNGVIEACH